MGHNFYNLKIVIGNMFDEEVMLPNLHKKFIEEGNYASKGDHADDRGSVDCSPPGAVGPATLV